MPDYSLYGRIGNAERWACTTEDDRRSATKPAREAWFRRFRTKALEKNPDLSGPDLVRAAEQLMQAHMSRMSMKAAAARRRKSNPAA